MILLSVSNHIKYENNEYIVEFVVKNDFGGITTMRKHCKDSKAADAIHKELTELYSMQKLPAISGEDIYRI